MREGPRGGKNHIIPKLDDRGRHGGAEKRKGQLLHGLNRSPVEERFWGSYKGGKF